MLVISKGVNYVPTREPNAKTNLTVIENAKTMINGNNVDIGECSMKWSPAAYIFRLRCGLRAHV
jgi:hypothetical protein